MDRYTSMRIIAFFFVQSVTRIVSPCAILTSQENYKSWKAQLENYLKSRDLFHHVVNDPPPPILNEAELRTWMKNDAAALHAIQVSCGMEVLSKISDSQSAKAAWFTLKKKFDPEVSKISLDDYKALNATDVLLQFEPFYKYITKGDWRSAKSFIKENPNARTGMITLSRMQALELAMRCEQIRVVEELVKLFDARELPVAGTFIHRAVETGNVAMAKCLVAKNIDLVRLKSDFPTWLPIVCAIMFGKIEMTRYLWPHTAQLIEEGKELLHTDGSGTGTTLLNDMDAPVLLTESIRFQMFDITLYLMRKHPQLVLLKSAATDLSPLSTLAACKSAFPRGSQLVFWKRWIYKCIQIKPAYVSFRETYIHVDQEENEDPSTQKKNMISGLLRTIGSFMFQLSGIKNTYDQKLVYVRNREVLRCIWDSTLKTVIEGHYQTGMAVDLVYTAISIALKEGNPEFVIELLKIVPLTALFGDITIREVFSLAIQCREPEVFSLIHGLNHKGTIVSIEDDDKNNLLHLAGQLGPPDKLNHISGAALQMQRELQWFKEMENIAQNMDKESLNREDMTPREVFSKNHKDLMKAGEKWMKEAATSCTVAAALIVTIMFAAAFTVPSSKNKDESAEATSLEKWFLIYIISDAVSLFSSITSVLMFLGILTSRYYEEAFLKSLPNKMIIGLSALFISIASMMISFCAALFVMLQGHLWVFIPVVLLASVTVILFVLLQFPILVEIFVSSYGSGIFHYNEDQNSLLY